MHSYARKRTSILAMCKVSDRSLGQDFIASMSSAAYSLSRESQAVVEKLQEGAGDADIPRLLAELDSTKKELQRFRSAADVGRQLNVQEELNSLKLIEAQNAEVRVMIFCASTRRSYLD